MRAHLMLCRLALRLSVAQQLPNIILYKFIIPFMTSYSEGQNHYMSKKISDLCDVINRCNIESLIGFLLVYKLSCDSELRTQNSEIYLIKITLQKYITKIRHYFFYFFTKHNINDGSGRHLQRQCNCRWHRCHPMI